MKLLNTCGRTFIRQQKIAYLSLLFTAIILQIFVLREQSPSAASPFKANPYIQSCHIIAIDLKLSSRFFVYLDAIWFSFPSNEELEFHISLSYVFVPCFPPKFPVQVGVLHKISFHVHFRNLVFICLDLYLLTPDSVCSENLSLNPYSIKSFFPLLTPCFQMALRDAFNKFILKQMCLDMS